MTISSQRLLYQLKECGLQIEYNEKLNMFNDLEDNHYKCNNLLDLLKIYLNEQNRSVSRKMCATLITEWDKQLLKTKTAVKCCEIEKKLLELQALNKKVEEQHRFAMQNKYSNIFECYELELEIGMILKKQQIELNKNDSPSFKVLTFFKERCQNCRKIIHFKG